MSELFSMQGRANRAWYFWHVLLDDVAIFTAMIVLLAVPAFLQSDLAMTVMMVPAGGVMLAGTWAAICVTVKRLHDLGRPGWHFLLFMIPIYNLWLGLVLLFKAGDPGTNEYGPDPLAGAHANAPELSRAV